MKKILILFSAVILILSCSRTQKQDELLIMCASANRKPMEEIARLYEKETGIKINFIFGGAGTLLNQIELTRKGDIYIPASPDFIQKGIEKKLIMENNYEILSYLIPSIFVKKGNPKNIDSLDDLTSSSIKLSIVNPTAGSIGVYSFELLEKNSLIPQIFGSILSLSRNYADLGNKLLLNQVDAIITWKIFKYSSGEIEEIKIAPDLIPRISYIPAAVTSRAQNITLAENFINYAAGQKGKDIFKKYGYIADKDEALSYAPSALIGGMYKLPENYYEIIKNVK